jgi:TPR repeat protein
MKKAKWIVWLGLMIVTSQITIFVDESIAQVEPLPVITISGKFYAVRNQDPKYPLKTRISKDTERQFSKFFTFTKTDRSRLLKLRAILQPLANLDDPVALYWLAKTYDLFEFGAGDEQDGKIALKYYNKAADLGMATVEYFLSMSYRYNFMGLSKDERKVISYLDRAKLHGDNEIKVEVLLSYARLYYPRERTDFAFIPRDPQKMKAALQEAYKLDPNNTTVADWLGEELYESQQYTDALTVYRHSSNRHTYQRIAKMYETGKGTSIDIASALLWYKKAAKQALSESEQNPVLPIYLRAAAVGDIYRLICQEKISPAAANPYFIQEDYQKYLRQTIEHQQKLKLKKNPCTLDGVG